MSKICPFRSFSGGGYNSAEIDCSSSCVLYDKNSKDCLFALYLKGGIKNDIESEPEVSPCRGSTRPVAELSNFSSNVRYGLGDPDECNNNSW